MRGHGLLNVQLLVDLRHTELFIAGEEVHDPQSDRVSQRPQYLRGGLQEIYVETAVHVRKYIDSSIYTDEPNLHAFSQDTNHH